MIRSLTNRKGYSGKRVGKVLLASVALVAIGAATAFAASIPNGNFESGNFSDWKIRNKGSGDWVIYDSGDRKKATKDRGGAILPKPFGEFSAAITQGGPSANVILRTVRVPADATVMSVKLFWINDGGEPPPAPAAQASADPGYWAFPGEWDFTGPRIQYFVVDLLKPSSPAFTAEKSDVLKTVFKPKIGATKARSGGWVTEAVDVAKFQGQRIKFRLVEADNSGYMNVGLDNLSFNTADLPTG